MMQGGTERGRKEEMGKSHDGHASDGPADTQASQRRITTTTRTHRIGEERPDAEEALREEEEVEVGLQARAERADQESEAHVEEELLRDEHRAGALAHVGPVLEQPGRLPHPHQALLVFEASIKTYPRLPLVPRNSYSESVDF